MFAIRDAREGPQLWIALGSGIDVHQVGASMSVATMMKPFLKRCWKASPQWVRLLAMQGICALRAERRSGAALGGEPIYYVCGAFYSKSGLGQSVRLYAADLEAKGKRVVCVDVTDAMVQPHDYAPHHAPMSLEQACAMQGGGTVVIHANPPHFQMVLCKLGKAFLAHKRVTAFWLWELEVLPNVWRQALEYVDAVEAPSNFVCHTLSQYTAKSVTVWPYLVPSPSRRKTAWAAGGIVRCLYVFDAGVSFERKNPRAVLEAFRKAFTPGEARLTFKVSNVDTHGSGYADFLSACKSVPGVVVKDAVLSDAEIDDLYLEHDIYLSLHRSEGYGLTIREAMLHGLQVVATGWSGNMDFMQGENCHAVPYRLAQVEFSHGPYKGLKARWAEADTEAAAGILRTIRERMLQGKAA